MSRKVETVRPYADATPGESKGSQVRRMFDAIAPGYDLMNRLMTAGLDLRWRRAVIDAVAAVNPSAILDIATGTGDLALAMARRCPEATVTGIDLSDGMLARAREKAAKAGLSQRVELFQADALSLPMPDNSFDAITVAFGVRNFQELDKGYAEMLRVLRPGGILCVLELTVPKSPVVKPFYNLYTGGLIPLAGKIFTGDAEAYRYLRRSIQAVPARSEMTALMADAGFREARCRMFAPGVCALYTAVKP